MGVDLVRVDLEVLNRSNIALTKQTWHCTCVHHNQCHTGSKGYTHHNQNHTHTPYQGHTHHNQEETASKYYQPYTMASKQGLTL